MRPGLLLCTACTCTPEAGRLGGRLSRGQAGGHAVEGEGEGEGSGRRLSLSTSQGREKPATTGKTPACCLPERTSIMCGICAGGVTFFSSSLLLKRLSLSALSLSWHVFILVWRLSFCHSIPIFQQTSYSFTFSTDSSCLLSSIYNNHHHLYGWW